MIKLFNQTGQGTLVTTQIEKIAAGGAGLSRIEGKTAFIEGSAPGDTLLCRVIAEHRSWLQAELVEIIEPSPIRVPPLCALYGKCGGCNLQHISYEAQIDAKTAILEEAFTRIGGFSPPKPSVFPSIPVEYRNRMQFHIIHEQKINESGALYGLKARKQREIIPISTCPIADPGIQAWIKDQNSKNQAQLPLPEKDRLSVYARNGLFLSEDGTSRGKTRILDRELALDVSVFFQSNGAMLEMLISDLIKIARGADVSLPMADIYCGVGTFAALVGELFPHIALVEENKTALALARENLMRHRSTAFFARRGEQWAHNTAARRYGCRYGLVIADPPRQGLEPALVQWLITSGPPLFAYVSCDPATLARDSKILVNGAYRFTDLRLYDFYPQSSHIESLAIFSR